MLEFFNDPKVAEQLGYLVKHVPFAVWETVYTTVVASLFAYLIGLPVLRLKSDYLAIATFGLCRDHPRRVPVG